MVTINGRAMGGCARVLDHYTVGGADLDTAVFNGRYRTHFSLLANIPGMKIIDITVVFFGGSREDIYMNKSRFDAQLLNVVEVGLPECDYTCYVEDIGDMAVYGNDAGGYIGEAAYTFSGYAHGDLVTKQGYNIVCTSTMPRTDCRLTVTVGVDTAEYVLGTVTFQNVSRGDVLVADGIEGRILVNGGPATGGISFTSFPYLVPGENTIVADDTPTVEYYPAYI